jgi:hypothetical protein
MFACLPHVSGEPVDPRQHSNESDLSKWMTKTKSLLRVRFLSHGVGKSDIAGSAY